MKDKALEAMFPEEKQLCSNSHLPKIIIGHTYDYPNNSIEFYRERPPEEIQSDNYFYDDIGVRCKGTREEAYKEIYGKEPNGLSLEEYQIIRKLLGLKECDSLMSWAQRFANED